MKDKVYLILDRNSEYPAFDVYNPGNVFSSEKAAIESIISELNMKDMIIFKVKKLMHTYVFITYKKWYTDEELKELKKEFDEDCLYTCYYTIRRVKSFVIHEETVK